MATEQDLKELKNKICDVVDNDTATKEDWFALWEKIEKCRKSCDTDTWIKFYSTSVIEMVSMIVAGYEHEEQKEKERLND